MLEFAGERVDCFKIDYFSCIENKIDIIVTTKCFIPETRTFFFKCQRDRRKLESFLKHLKEDKEQLRCRRRSSLTFLHREFECLAGPGRNHLAHRDVENYLKNLNVFNVHANLVREFYNIDQFSMLIRNILNEKSDFLFKIFTKYSQTWNGGKYMPEDNLARFVNIHQNENLDCSQLMRKHQNQERDHNENTEIPSCWDYEEFLGYLCSEEKGITNPEDDTMYQDMTKPLSMYWINSSHNTYLKGCQIDLSKSSSADIKAYEQALRRGVRCIEIDVWNGPKKTGEVTPMVYHGIPPGGFPVSSKLQLSDVLQTINAHAFTTSEYPLIISIELHCNLENQRVVAKLFNEILGDKLLKEKVFKDESCLPSPEDLKKKIILKGYKCENQYSHVQNEEQEEPLNDIYIGHVFVKKANCKWKEQELFFRGSCLVFGNVINNKLENEKTLELAYSCIVLTKLDQHVLENVKQCIEVTTITGDTYEITKEADLERFFTTLVCWKNSKEVSLYEYVQSVIMCPVFLGRACQPRAQ